MEDTLQLKLQGENIIHLEACGAFCLTELVIYFATVSPVVVCGIVHTKPSVT